MGKWVLTLYAVLGAASMAHAGPTDASDSPITADTDQEPPNDLVGLPPTIGAPINPDASVPSAQVTPVYVQGDPSLQIPEQVVPPPGYPIRAARTRLAVIQGLNGAALGAEICALLAPNTDERRCTPFPFLLGGAAALVAGLAVRPGITSDHVTAINAGTVLGAWHGTLVLGMTGLLWRPEGADRQVGAISMMAGAQIIGTLAGHFIYRAHPAREGVVDAASVLSLWGGLSTAMLIAGYADPTESSAPHARQFGTMMFGTELALGLGVLVGRHTHFTPFRALMVHAYALGGGLAGIVIGLPVAYRNRDGSSVNENDFWRAMGFGTLIGAVGGIFATGHLGDRGMVGPAFAFDVRPVSQTVVMVDGQTTQHGGAIATISGGF